MGSSQSGDAVEQDSGRGDLVNGDNVLATGDGIFSSMASETGSNGERWMSTTGNVDEADFSPRDRTRQTMLSQLVLTNQLREFRSTDINYDFENDPSLQYIPRAEAPRVKTAAVVQTDFHVRTKSIRLQPPRVRFILDSTIPCSVRINYNLDWDCPSLATGASSPSAATNVKHPQIGQEMELIVRDDAGDFVIEVSADAELAQREWTCWKGGEKGCVQKQIIRVKGDRGESSRSFLEAKELFGANEEQQDLTRVCGICMDREPDTAVLPCRHLCLCSTCAELFCKRVQNQSYRCPLCRERTSSLLQMEPSGIQQQQENAN